MLWLREPEKPDHARNRSRRVGSATEAEQPDPVSRSPRFGEKTISTAHIRVNARSGRHVEQSVRDPLCMAQLGRIRRRADARIVPTDLRVILDESPEQPQHVRGVGRHLVAGAVAADHDIARGFHGVDQPSQDEVRTG